MTGSTGFDTLEVTLHNQASQISQAHEALDQFAARHGLSVRVVRAFHLALEEHLSNCITYGFKPAQLGTIQVRFKLEPPVVRVEIEDNAVPFNPLTAPEVDTSLPLDEKPLGGLGLLLIRRSVDQAEYHRANEHNVLILKKRIG